MVKLFCIGLLALFLNALAPRLLADDLPTGYPSSLYVTPPTASGQSGDVEMTWYTDRGLYKSSGLTYDPDLGWQGSGWLANPSSVFFLTYKTDGSSVYARRYDYTSDPFTIGTIDPTVYQDDNSWGDGGFSFPVPHPEGAEAAPEVATLSALLMGLPLLLLRARRGPTSSCK